MFFFTLLLLNYNNLILYYSSMIYVKSLKDLFSLIVNAQKKKKPFSDLVLPRKYYPILNILCEEGLIRRYHLYKDAYSNTTVCRLFYGYYGFLQEPLFNSAKVFTSDNSKSFLRHSNLMSIKDKHPNSLYLLTNSSGVCSLEKVIEAGKGGILLAKIN